MLAISLKRAITPSGVDLVDLPIMKCLTPPGVKASSDLNDIIDGDEKADLLFGLP